MTPTLRWTALVLVSCAHSSEPPQEIALPLPTPSAVASASPKAHVATGPCDEQTDLGACESIGVVHVGTINVRPTCEVDLALGDGDTGEIFRCARGAKIRFDRATFVGTLEGTTLDVCATTTYQGARVDHCTWETMQTIRGSTASRILRFTYNEHVTAESGECGTQCVVTTFLTP